MSILDLFTVPDLLKFAAGLLAWPAKTLAVATWNRLIHDLPPIHGTYKSDYRYRLEGGEEVDAKETIRVTKIGRWVWATAEMTQPGTKKWKIKGEIRGSYLFATVESSTRKTLSGKGLILLKSLENASELEGHMTWIDSRLKVIYSTPYVWKQVKDEKD